MITLLLLIPIAALLILDYFIADEFRCIARRKGYCGRKYFWWSFFTGPIGHLMVIALPNCGFCAGQPSADPKPTADPYSKCHC